MEQKQTHRFEFTGTGMEYFWICLRTFLLAMITLGIYDAWGTVERRRYLYGHTQVAGHGFDYHAKPKTILIGRLIALGLIIAFQVLSSINPIVSSVLVLGILPAIPWMINRSLRFQLRNTSYRNVRFNFGGSYWKAFVAYLLMPITVSLSFGMSYPVVVRAMREYIVNNLSYGKAGFTVRIPLKPLYGAFFVCILLLAVSAGVIFYFERQALLPILYDAGLDTETAVQGLVVIGFILLFVVAMPILLIFQVTFRNAMVRNMALEGGHTFHSTLPIPGYIWVLLSSGFLATVSAGLLLPWATVRIHRYEMTHTELLAAGSLDNFAAQQTDAGDAIGAELGSMEGVTDGLLSGI